MLELKPLQDRALIEVSFRTMSVSCGDVICGQAWASRKATLIASRGAIRVLSFLGSLFVSCLTVFGLEWQRGPGYQFAEIAIPPNDPGPGGRVGFVEMPPNHTGVSFTNA